jgi:D-glycero-alpha-D-manno-heptose-7-phosphate kinase
MIVARSPLRISIAGGGTDLPSYYREHEGFLIAAAIDKYVYVTVSKPFRKGYFLKYSDYELVQAVDDIKHPILRESLRLVGGFDEGVEISSFAEIPAGTGLGSSGSFTTALLKALHLHKRESINQDRLAELACKVEIELLSEPVGKQDQYIAAFGGLNCFTFKSDNSVTSEPLRASPTTLKLLEESLLLFFTGFSRSAAQVLRDQDQRTANQDSQMLENLHHVKRLGLRSRDALERGSLSEYAEIMREHWELKKQRLSVTSVSKIDYWYELGIKNGATAGKIVGAGGGGFLMFLAEDPKRLRISMANEGLCEVDFHFDFEGTRLIST